MAKDYYSLLGVNKSASQDEIKKAFRKKAKQYHPDANRDDPTAEARFKEINEAYDVLGDETKRKQYDQFGTNWSQFAQQGDFNNGGAYNYTRNVNPEDLNDILEQMFGGAAGSPFSGGRSPFGGGRSPFGGGFGRQRPQPQRGQDIEQSVRITLEEAYSGTERLLNKDGRQLRVSIPPGADTGTKVRLKGEGYNGVRGGQSGDLYLVVEVYDGNTPFTRDGDNLIVEVEVDAFTAMLGGDVEIPTMERPVRLKIPAGSQTGRKFRLSGKGMPKMKGDGNGDLYAKLVITIPTKLNDEQKQLAEQLRDSLN